MAANRNVDYGTPQWLFDQLDAEFHFTIDACALPHNAKCLRFWGPEQDGLRLDWAGETPFWNCPFDDAGAWARKAYNESLRGITSVGLVPTRRQEYWFQLCAQHAQMRMVQGGILLFAGGGDQAGRLARQDCTLFVFGPGFQGGTIGPFLVPPYKPNDQPRLRPTGIRQYSAALNKPEETKVLRTYAELVPYIDAFGDGAFDLLIVVGRPGLSKSTEFRNRLPETTCWITGNISAFRAYCKLYEYRDQLTVFDDVDTRKPAMVNLLRQLCNNDDVTTPTWDTDAAWLKENGIPNQFETSTKVCLMVNDWATLNAHVAALEDRAVIISFEPTAAEVHEQVRRENWFEDQEIYNFIGQHLGLITKPTMRSYVKAKQHKNAGLNWKAYLWNLWFEDEDLVNIAQLLNDPVLPSMRAKAQAFVERRLGSRATFFRKARILRAA